MAAALTRSASVTDSSMFVGTDTLTSPMGVAGDRVCSGFAAVFMRAFGAS